jgi:hypothetical protein
MAKYYVTSGGLKETISCDSSRQAALKAIEVSKEKMLDLGLAISVNEVGFMVFDHDTSKLFDTKELLEELGILDKMVATDLTEEQLFNSKAALSVGALSEAMKFLLKASEVLKENALFDKVTLLADETMEVISEIASNKDPSLLEPYENNEDDE